MRTAVTRRFPADDSLALAGAARDQKPVLLQRRPDRRPLLLARRDHRQPQVPSTTPSISSAVFTGIGFDVTTVAS